MTICILAMGSRGDVQPAIALAQRLSARGHRVRLAAPLNFAGLSAGRGFEFFALPVDAMEEVRSPDADILFSGGGSLAAFIRWSVKTGRKWAAILTPAVAKAGEGAELVVATGLMDTIGGALAESRRIPCVHAWWSPMIAAADFSFATFERAPPPVPGFLNRWIFHVFEQALWLAMRSTLNAQRDQLGLPPTGLTPSLRAAIRRGEPFLLAYSGELLPRSREWPANVETTGYWFLEDRAPWSPPPALEAFLSAGPPPAFVGFGSMAFKDSFATLAKTLQAIEATGARAILSAGWGGLKAAELPPSIFAIEEAPHDWLFPRMAAIVHHGGAGTTGAAVRAGKPSVVTPFILDQFPWARLLEARGVAPPPIPHRLMTAETLASALAAALTDVEMRRRAEVLGEKVRAEDGLGRAAELIERALPLSARAL